MKRFSGKTVVLGVGLGLVVVALLAQAGGFGTVAASGGAEVSPAAATKATIVLSLVGVGSGGCGPSQVDFQQVMPDGTGGGIFRVPSGKYLVVTDVDWEYVSPSGGSAAGTIQTLRLFIQNLNDPNLQGQGMESTITLSSMGQGGASDTAATGFVVSSAARVCPDVTPGPMGPPSGVQHIVLRGYLTTK